MEKRIHLVDGEMAVGLETSLLVLNEQGQWGFANQQCKLLKVRNALSCKQDEHWLLHQLGEEYLIDQVSVYSTLLAIGGWEVIGHNMPNIPETIDGKPVMGQLTPCATFETRNSQLAVKRDGSVKMGYLESNQILLKFSEPFNGPTFHNLLENLVDLMGLAGIAHKQITDNETDGSVFLLNEWNVDNSGPAACW
jgi:hypothetical protein